MSEQFGFLKGQSQQVWPLTLDKSYDLNKLLSVLLDKGLNKENLSTLFSPKFIKLHQKGGLVSARKHDI